MRYSLAWMSRGSRPELHSTLWCCLMDARELVDRFNLLHGTRYTLHARYAAGENQGAYALAAEHGVACVLKWNERLPSRGEWLWRIRYWTTLSARRNPKSS